MSDHVLNLLDGADEDATVSGIAMRWTPRRADYESSYAERYPRTRNGDTEDPARPTTEKVTPQ